MRAASEELDRHFVCIIPFHPSTLCDSVFFLCAAFGPYYFLASQNFKFTLGPTREWNCKFNTNSCKALAGGVDTWKTTQSHQFTFGEHSGSPMAWPHEACQPSQWHTGSGESTVLFLYFTVLHVSQQPINIHQLKPIRILRATKPCASHKNSQKPQDKSCSQASRIIETRFSRTVSHEATSVAYFRKPQPHGDLHLPNTWSTAQHTTFQADPNRFWTLADQFRGCWPKTAVLTLSNS